MSSFYIKKAKNFRAPSSLFPIACARDKMPPLIQGPKGSDPRFKMFKSVTEFHRVCSNFVIKGTVVLENEKYGKFPYTK